MDYFIYFPYITDKTIYKWRKCLLNIIIKFKYLKMSHGLTEVTKLWPEESNNHQEKKYRQCAELLHIHDVHCEGKMFNLAISYHRFSTVLP